MKGDEDKPWKRTREEADDEPPSPTRIIEAARRRVKAPAIALMFVGFINSGLGVVVMAMGFVVGGMNMGAAEGAIGIINTLAGLAILAGGLNLLRLENYGLVRTGSITAMVPCISLCLILGLPIGIWALVTASSPDVQEAYRQLRRKPEDREAW